MLLGGPILFMYAWFWLFYSSSPKEFTQLGLYNRYQEEVLSKGQGRLADIDSHNKAVNGLMKSANQLYSDKAVDKISIHTYLAKERIKDFNLVNGEWSCKSMPSIFIDESRSKQMKNIWENTGREIRYFLSYWKITSWIHSGSMICAHCPYSGQATRRPVWNR